MFKLLLLSFLAVTSVCQAQVRFTVDKAKKELTFPLNQKHRLYVNAESEINDTAIIIKKLSPDLDIIAVNPKDLKDRVNISLFSNEFTSINSSNKSSLGVGEPLFFNINLYGCSNKKYLVTIEGLDKTGRITSCYKTAQSGELLFADEESPKIFEISGNCSYGFKYSQNQASNVELKVSVWDGKKQVCSKKIQCTYKPDKIRLKAEVIGCTNNGMSKTVNYRIVSERPVCEDVTVTVDLDITAGRTQEIITDIIVIKSGKTSAESGVIKVAKGRVFKFFRTGEIKVSKVEHKNINFSYIY